jgi:hypothetical protein
MRRRFMPSPVAIHWLIAIAFTSVGYAMYLRYLAIEYPVVGLACDAGLTTWLCLSRKVALPLYEYNVIGGLAVVAAVIQLLRPSVIAFALALAAAGLGLVLFNAGLAGLAIALLVLSLARPAGTGA